MGQSTINTILKTPLQAAGKTSPSYDKRLLNIGWIKALDRKGMSFQVKERQLLVYTTAAGERLFIQYPGKESSQYNKNGKEREVTAIRPWDFRPRLYLPNSTEHLKDNSFADIWATIFEMAEILIKDKKKDFLRILATLLYRMAFMEDHRKTDGLVTKYRDVTFDDSTLILGAERDIKLPGSYKYSPAPELLKYLKKECPKWGDISTEAFLAYNESLTWNEDCKYYFRNYHTKPTDKPKWISSTGRVNTLLTHIRILGYILGDIHLASIFNDFSNQRGVSPASGDEVSDICKGYICRS